MHNTADDGVLIKNLQDRSKNYLQDTTALFLFGVLSYLVHRLNVEIGSIVHWMILGANGGQHF
ncbi:MAG: hypothetical protein AAF431_19975 [Pseudomonadota bacterium]